MGHAMLALISWLTLQLVSSIQPTEQGPSSTSAPGFLGSLRGHEAGIYALAVSDQLVASGSKDGSILTWNLTGAAMQDASDGAMETPLQKLSGHAAGVTALTLRDELLASGAADNSTKLWNVATGELVRQLPHPKTVFGLSISGKQLASACWDGVARIYDLENEVEPMELRGHTGGLYEVSHSPLDPTLLATASADRTVRVWDLKTGRQLWKFMHKDHVTALDWSPVNFTLATGGWDRRFRIWKIHAEEVAKCRGGVCGDLLFPEHVARHPQLLWSVAFAPEGRQVAACHGAVGQSPAVVVYEVSTGERLRRLGRHKDTPLALGFSPSGEYLVSAGMDRKVLIYSATEHLDDMPLGDKDDAEERLNWLHDLEDLRGGSRNASSIADLARELARRNRSKTRGSKSGSFRAMPGVAFL
ncbi:unnamed protein product [Cladocopium goreaui]|uniref:Uncharacterized WD repeat-containing protein alr2800 n=1 Tax=Cladocopium goreaui TaxID=2562237 RepID=A0A9P1CZZ8_9DINO|nr:unnamed protein product [Cladocopium goreaui]